MTTDPRALDGDFTIALWLHVPEDRAGVTGDLASSYDPARRKGFTLSAVSSAGGYNGPGDELRISFGLDDGSTPTWEHCGRPSPTSNLCEQLAYGVRRRTPRGDHRRSRRGGSRACLPVRGRPELARPRQGRRYRRDRHRPARRSSGQPLCRAELRLDPHRRWLSKPVPCLPLRRTLADGRTAASPGRLRGFRPGIPRRHAVDDRGRLHRTRVSRRDDLGAGGRIRDVWPPDHHARRTPLRRNTGPFDNMGAEPIDLD